MRRRELIAPLGAAAWPLAARAQQSERLPRVGLLMAYANDDENQISVPFRKRLEELGWIDGRNVRIEGEAGGLDGQGARAYGAAIDPAERRGGDRIGILATPKFELPTAESN
jgi:putative tryptophan/tyrosine transport system substrate-binding protein